MMRVILLAMTLALMPAPVRGAQPGSKDRQAERVYRLLELLSDRDYRVRLQAAVALGQIKDPRAVPALIAALKDSHRFVRGTSAAALGVIGDTRAAGPLRNRLNDRDALVRRRARAALDHIRKYGQAGDPPDKPVLLRLAGVGARTKPGGVLVPRLRQIWTDRIAHTPGIQLISGSARGRKVYEVTASIAELSSQRRGDLVETTCSLSVVVGDDRGSIVMVTSGGATVQLETRRFDKSQQPALHAQALEGAVASVHSNVVKFFATR